MLPRIVFLLCLLVSASGFVSPPVALAMGLVFGLAFPHPYGEEAKKFSRFLLQASVVGLGFGMDLHQVVQAGRSGFVYTMLGISFALLAGMGLGALLGVQRVPAFLISAGTAICGGSAIAAVGPITQATDEEMAVALGTVFVLNSVALLIFPAIGAAFKLTQSQFGLWAALAIHDTSSVVGAAAKYGAEALAIATTVKLARALWIVPLSVGNRGRARAQGEDPVAVVHRPVLPGGVCNTYLPGGAHVYGLAVRVAKIGLTATLFLIGSGISVATIKQVGYRALLQGIILWLLVSVGSLWLIRAGWIALVKKGSKAPQKRRAKSPPVRSSDQSSTMRMRIEAAIRRIPQGKVSTYGAVARAAGLPRRGAAGRTGAASRLRVALAAGLGAGGEIKLRGDSAIEQRLRLEAEGVRFRGRKVDMKQCEFKFAARERAEKAMRPRPGLTTNE